MKFDRNEKTIKMALSFSESDDFENFTKISVVVWYLYVFLGQINDCHGLKNDRSQFKFKHACYGGGLGGYDAYIKKRVLFIS